MKILHVIPSLNKGGAERLALDSCLELQNQGHDVLIVTLRPENRYNFLTDKLNYKTITTSITLSLIRKNKINISNLQAIIDSFYPDIIHSHLFEAEINLAFCKIPKKCKRVIHFHDNMKQFRSCSLRTFLNKELLTNYYERSLVLKNLQKTSSFISISKDSYNYAQNNLSKKNKIFLLNNAINTKRFIPAKTENKEPILTMIGSLVQKKGQQLAIKTIHELKLRNKEIKLQFLGGGEMETELIELSKSLQIEHLINFAGIVDFPEKYLQDSSIYIHTASYEPFGLVLIEAMACGLPVVCTDGYGNREIIKEGKNGFMIWERNPKLIADKIEFLLDNELERKNMGEYAHQFAQNFGIEEYVRKLVEIYKIED